MSNPDRPENFIEKLRSLQLSADASSAMRERLAAYADLHEMPSRRPVPSYFMWRYGYAIAVVAVLLVGGAGVSYAANDSLPGQPLYAVKVNFNEPLAGALIPGTAAKASWENVLAERRLAEASTLAAQNKLDAKTRTFIEQQVELHTTRAEQDATKLADAGKNDQALAIRSDLEARLTAHADLLALITPRLAIAGDTQTSSQAEALFQKVEAERSTAAQARISSEVAIAGPSAEAPAVTAAKPAATAKTAAPVHLLTVGVGATPQPQAAAQATELVQQADQKRTEETQTLFAKRAATLMAFLPPATTTATSTASTTEATTTPSETATTTPVSASSSATTTASSTESSQ